MERRFYTLWLATPITGLLLVIALAYTGVLGGSTCLAIFLAAMGGLWFGPVVGVLMLDRALVWTLPAVIVAVPLAPLAVHLLSGRAAPQWALVAAPIVALVAIRLLAPRARAAVPAHVCARCGYDLTGLGERACPECGR